MKYRVFLTIILLGAIIGNINAQVSQSTKVKAAFTWGVDVGSSIDMTTNGMSSIDGDAYFGFKNSFFRTLGVGASMHSTLGNGNTFIPVYALMRTSFTTRPSLCFVDFRGGYSFNSINNEDSHAGAFGSIGLGFNLYSNDKFKSHIILAYNYFNLSNNSVADLDVKTSNLHEMSIRIGISF